VEREREGGEGRGNQRRWPGRRHLGKGEREREREAKRRLEVEVETEVEAGCQVWMERRRARVWRRGNILYTMT